ncbi:hypothetical protein Ancab_025148 [Ancistrocladus abbreviatus]
MEEVSKGGFRQHEVAVDNGDASRSAKKVKPKPIETSFDSPLSYMAKILSNPIEGQFLKDDMEFEEDARVEWLSEKEDDDIPIVKIPLDIEVTNRASNKGNMELDRRSLPFVSITQGRGVHWMLHLINA